MYNINDYMTPEEAAHRWRIPPETVKNKTKPSTANQEEIEQMIKNGLIKYFQKPGGKRKEWIISTAAMEFWFLKKDVE
ncbi:DNA-binding protein (plasmid) [Sporosarcina psychrophila]|uniref:DNA-binding protein n=1 Tax=Sporosarcina psychrophila TaxID=1476 RepID=UPI0030D3DE37